MWGDFRARLFGNDIFISYSSTDREWAIAAEQLLSSGGHRVFRDDTKLRAGDHLERLLWEVRRSTMLVVLVSDDALDSDWVRRELEAYVERPRKRWRMAPIFLNPRYPRDLHGRREPFPILSEFRGIKLPIPTEPASPLSSEVAWFAGLPERERVPALQELAGLLRKYGIDLDKVRNDVHGQFRATRKSARQRIAAGLLTLAIAGTVGTLEQRINRNAKRDEFLAQAVAARADARFDFAERALARVWALDATPKTLEAYREAREHRILERPVVLSVRATDGVLAVDQGGDGPYAIVHANEKPDALVLIHREHRMLLASPCSAAPVVRTEGKLAVWACGEQVGVVDVSSGRSTVVTLPAAPVDLRLSDAHVEYLFREDAAAQVAVFDLFPKLLPHPPQVLHGAVAGGEIGFCPAPGRLAWGISVDRGRLVLRQWEGGDVQDLSVRAFDLENADGTQRPPASWISRVIPSSSCDRYFIEYAEIAASTRSTFQMVRVRPTFGSRVDRIDDGIERLVPVDDASGIEAVYLTAGKELRAFLLTSPVVLASQVRTLASDVQRFSAWTDQKNPRTVWTIAARRGQLVVFRNQELWSRYEVDAGDIVRVVRSPSGTWIAVEGQKRTVLWHRSEPWSGAAPPSLAAIEADTLSPP